MKTRVAVVAAIAAASLIGCAPYKGSMAGPERAGYGGLSAYLIPHFDSAMPGFNIDVSESAYAAVFRIMPGGGSFLVYPRPGSGPMNGFVRSGLNWVDSRNLRFSDVTFANQLGGPEFYLLIASEEPLRLEQFGPFGDNINWVVGFSVSGYSMMERLVMAAVPNVEATNWTTDYYVHWPEMLHRRPGRNLVPIACGDHIWYVPADAALYAQSMCDRAEQEAETDEATPATPEDSTSVVEPRRRPPPEPIIEERLVSTQLEAPEEFDARRQAAEEGRVVRVRNTRPAMRTTEWDRPSDRLRRSPSVGGSARAGDDRPTTTGTAGATRRSGGDRSSPPPATQPTVRPEVGGSDGGARDAQ